VTTPLSHTTLLEAHSLSLQPPRERGSSSVGFTRSHSVRPPIYEKNVSVGRRRPLLLLPLHTSSAPTDHSKANASFPNVGKAPMTALYASCGRVRVFPFRLAILLYRGFDVNPSLPVPMWCTIIIICVARYVMPTASDTRLASTRHTQKQGTFLDAASVRPNKNTEVHNP